MRRSTVAGAALVTSLAVGGAAGGYGVTHAIRADAAARAAHATATPPSTTSSDPALSATPTPIPVPTPTPTPMPVPTRAAPVPTPAGVAAALRTSITAGALGPRLGAQVIDATSGAVLARHHDAMPVAPASTAKLLTATALLSVARPTDRITTTVRLAGSTAILVGAGDPTLSAAPAGKPTLYAQAARLSDLAAALQARLRRTHRHLTAIDVDDSLFTGPSVSPTWGPGDVPSSYAGAVTALSVDGGRATPGADSRSATPDLAAGHEFAALLAAPDLPVTRRAAPSGARVVAQVRSAPLNVLISQMLEQSDNMIAESLGRLVALTTRHAASFTGAATAIADVLRRYGIVVGSGMSDASGLAAADRLSARTLVAVLAQDYRSPPLRWVLAGLPVAGWSGTLAGRFRTAGTRSAVGRVQAKTGTLTGVSALAGLVRDKDGRVLLFAVLAGDTGPTPAAEAALDVVAADLAGCGCR